MAYFGGIGSFVGSVVVGSLGGADMAKKPKNWEENKRYIAEIKEKIKADKEAFNRKIKER